MCKNQVQEVSQLSYLIFFPFGKGSHCLFPRISIKLCTILGLFHCSDSNPSPSHKLCRLAIYPLHNCTTVHILLVQCYISPLVLLFCCQVYILDDSEFLKENTSLTPLRLTSYIPGPGMLYIFSIFTSLLKLNHRRRNLKEGSDGFTTLGLDSGLNMKEVTCIRLDQVFIRFWLLSVEECTSFCFGYGKCRYHNKNIRILCENESSE